MNLDANLNKRVEELKALEQTIQNFLAQRQAAQMESNEIQNALEELKGSKGETYKIIGGVMIQTDKQSTLKELEEKKKIVELRMQAVEKQEKIVEKRATELRKEINEAVLKGSSRNDENKK